jgi:hypothetical protein
MIALIQIAPLIVIGTFQLGPNVCFVPGIGNVHFDKAGPLANPNFAIVPVALIGSPPSAFYNLSTSVTSFDGTTLTIAQVFAPQPLPQVQVALCQQVDQQAETIRLRYITQGSGQALTYKQKFDEATAFKADPSPQPANYPLLSSTVGIEGAALSDVANFVLTTTATWTTIASNVEKARLGGKQAINAVATVDAAVAAFNSIVWPQ